MKKGFTLIELIGVIVIIGLMVTIIVPAVSKALKTGTQRADEQTKNSIVLAAKNWSIDNKDKIKNNCCISLADLEVEELIDIESYKLSDDTDISNSGVAITSSGKQFTWTASCPTTTCN